MDTKLFTAKLFITATTSLSAQKWVKKMEDQQNEIVYSSKLNKVGLYIGKDKKKLEANSRMTK